MSGCSYSGTSSLSLLLRRTWGQLLTRVDGGYAGRAQSEEKEPVLKEERSRSGEAHTGRQKQDEGLQRCLRRKMEAAPDADAVGAALNIATVHRDSEAVAADDCDQIG